MTFNVKQYYFVILALSAFCDLKFNYGHWYGISKRAKLSFIHHLSLTLV
jgi:hypothetical protein